MLVIIVLWKGTYEVRNIYHLIFLIILSNNFKMLFLNILRFKKWANFTFATAVCLAFSLIFFSIILVIYGLKLC